MASLADTLTSPEMNKTEDNTAVASRRSSSNDEKLRDSASGKDVEAAPQPPAFDESKILSGKKLILAFLAMMLSVLLIALGSS